MTKKLPIYQCHKLVRAAQIVRIEPIGLVGHYLHLNGDMRVECSADWMHKHSPKIGGYYVVYDDNYTSFSPCKAFENGYNLWKKPEKGVGIDLKKLKEMCVEQGMDQSVADMAFDEEPPAAKVSH